MGILPVHFFFNYLHNYLLGAFRLRKVVTEFPNTYVCSWDQMGQISWVGDLRYELGVLSSLEGDLWMTSL